MVSDRVRLLQGLLSSPEKFRLYESNLFFHNSIDVLVTWLSLWIGAMAEEAEHSQRLTDEQIKQLANSPIVPLVWTRDDD